MPGEVQLLDDAKRIREFAADPTCVIGQDDIEGPRFFASCREKFFQSGSLVGRSRDGLVRIDVFVQHLQAAPETTAKFSLGRLLGGQARIIGTSIKLRATIQANHRWLTTSRHRAVIICFSGSANSPSRGER